MADFGKITARVHRKTGVARPLVLTEPDGTSPRTYADCKGNEGRGRGVADGLDAFETTVKSVVRIPRLSGAVKPVPGEFAKLSASSPEFAVAGAQFQIANVEETAGMWKITS